MSRHGHADAGYAATSHDAAGITSPQRVAAAPVDIRRSYAGCHAAVSCHSIVERVGVDAADTLIELPMPAALLMSLALAGYADMALYAEFAGEEV